MVDEDKAGIAAGKVEYVNRVIRGIAKRLVEEAACVDKNDER